MPAISEESLNEDQELQSRDASNDEDLLIEARRNYKSDLLYWQQIRDEGDIDIQFLCGDSWDAEEKNSRTFGAPDTKRLCLNFDELNQNLNQVCNNFRQNVPGIKIEPKGYGAEAKIAELRENMVRQIQYQSDAVVAYTTAYENQVSRSEGWLQICRDWESPESFNQEIFIEAIPNVNVVIPDQNSVKIDGSDMKRCFKLRKYSLNEYRNNWPDAKFQSFGAEYISNYGDWFGDDWVLVAEYWKVEEKRKKLVQLDAQLIVDGERKSTIVVDDYPGLSVKKLKATVTRKPGKYLVMDATEDAPEQVLGYVVRERETITEKVKQYVINAVEVLEKNDSPGRHIPIVPFFGRIRWINAIIGSQRVIFSLIRLARDAQQAYSYVRTTQMELIGQVPKTPFIGAVGQFNGFEEDWDMVNRVRLAYLQYNAIMDATGNNILPPPQQMHYEPAIAALEVMAESLRRAVQSAMGQSPLPTDAMRLNQKSGKALQQIDTNQAVGTYHFVDNAKKSIQHVGKIINAWLADVYDTPRDVGVRKEDATYSVTSNFQQEKNLLEQGEFAVTISTEPSYQSQRQEASEFADLLAQSNPQVFALLGPLIVRLKQLGPIGDQMADLLEYLQPPELRAKEDAEQGQDPQKAMQRQLTQAMQQLQMAKQAIQELSVKASQEQTKVQTTDMDNKAALEKETVSKRAEIQRAQMEIEAEDRRLAMQLQAQKEIAAANNETQIAIKQMDLNSKAGLEVLNHTVEAVHKDLDLQQKTAEMQVSQEQFDADLEARKAQADAKVDASDQKE